MSCSVLLRPCSATQPSPGRRHRLPGSSLACSFAALLLGLLLSGAVLWLVRRLRRGATRAADPCRFRLVSWSHTRAGSLRVQHVARCVPRAVHAAHVRAQCHANGHTRVGVSGWVSRLGHSRHVSAHAHGHPPTREQRHRGRAEHRTPRAGRVADQLAVYACARACPEGDIRARVRACLVCVCPCRHSTLTAEPQHRHEPMTTGAATGSSVAQWKSAEDGWPPKRPAGVRVASTPLRS